MKKKFFALSIALVMVAGIVTFALSKGATYSGKVAQVKGNKVTIELQKDQASKFSVGDSVEMEIKKKKEKADSAESEEEFLMGC